MVGLRWGSRKPEQSHAAQAVDAYLIYTTLESVCISEDQSVTFELKRVGGKYIVERVILTDNYN